MRPILITAPIILLTLFLGGCWHVPSQPPAAPPTSGGSDTATSTTEIDTADWQDFGVIEVLGLRVYLPSQYELVATSSLPVSAEDARAGRIPCGEKINQDTAIFQGKIATTLSSFSIVRDFPGPKDKECFKRVEQFTNDYDFTSKDALLATLRAKGYDRKNFKEIQDIVTYGDGWWIHYHYAYEGDYEGLIGRGNALHGYKMVYDDNRKRITSRIHVSRGFSLGDYKGSIEDIKTTTAYKEVLGALSRIK